MEPALVGVEHYDLTITRSVSTRSRPIELGTSSRKEVERKEREAEDERSARYKAIYEDLGLRVVARPDGTLEASWRPGEAVLRVGSDTSPNRHATKHFHASEHPIIRSFEPGEDWRWCYVDEVLV
jgi:hypothetical protein